MVRGCGCKNNPIDLTHDSDDETVRRRSSRVKKKGTKAKKPRALPKCTEGKTRRCGKVCRSINRACKVKGFEYDPGVTNLTTTETVTTTRTRRAPKKSISLGQLEEKRTIAQDRAFKEALLKAAGNTSWADQIFNRQDYQGMDTKTKKRFWEDLSNRRYITATISEYKKWPEWEKEAFWRIYEEDHPPKRGITQTGFL